jgi:O-antigen/teichoic acid export membrane protein
MEKEFGKWLMDVAKYMATALLLSTIFSDMNDPITIYSVVILTLSVLIIGMVFVYNGENKTNKKKGNRK